jgi:hypothetical protein
VGNPALGQLKEGEMEDLKRTKSICKSCEDYERWLALNAGFYQIGHAHGLIYPNDGPKFKYCPFCGVKLTWI